MDSPGPTNRRRLVLLGIALTVEGLLTGLSFLLTTGSDREPAGLRGALSSGLPILAGGFALFVSVPGRARPGRLLSLFWLAWGAAVSSEVVAMIRTLGAVSLSGRSPL